MLGAETSTSGDFYVAAGGSDDNAGTIDEPFATLARARDGVRKRKAGKASGGRSVVSVRGGRYYLAAPFELREGDAA